MAETDMGTEEHQDLPAVAETELPLLGLCFESRPPLPPLLTPLLTPVLILALSKATNTPLASRSSRALLPLPPFQMR